VSQLELGSLVTGMANGDVVDVARNSIPAELIGGLRTDQEWPLNDTEFQYWNRMIRCAYRDDIKVVWDSLGQISEYHLDRETSSFEEEIGELESVPTWAEEFFDEDIQTYKKRALEMETSFDRIDESTRDQLEELGYLWD